MITSSTLTSYSRPRETRLDLRQGFADGHPQSHYSSVSRDDAGMLLVAPSGPAPDLGFVVMVATFVGLPFAVMGAGALWSALFGRVNSDGGELDADEDGKFSDRNAR